MRQTPSVPEASATVSYPGLTLPARIKTSCPTDLSSERPYGPRSGQVITPGGVAEGVEALAIDLVIQADDKERQQVVGVARGETLDLTRLHDEIVTARVAVG